MDQSHYTTLVEALQEIVDHRKARGQRYPWLLLLTLIALALVSGQRSVHAIADWVEQHWEELVAELHPVRTTWPSEATFRRALRTIDPEGLERRLGQVVPAVPVIPDSAAASDAAATSAVVAPLEAQAIDGKALRGTGQHGQKVHLVSMVRHRDSVTTAQTAVAEKSNEITAVARLLAGHNLNGTVTTMDALLTQRTIAQQIVEQHGHYLMVVKANQPELYQAIELLFTCPPWTKKERTCEYACYCYETKGHGRLEQRTLESSPPLNAYLDWPGLGQVLRRTCRRINRKTGEVSVEVTYGITSLTRTEADAMRLEQIWRGHWSIENRVHYVRDVTLGEDACQVHVGNTARVLAAWRDAVLNLFRQRQWHNISDAVRHYAAKVTRALALISSHPARL